MNSESVARHPLPWKSIVATAILVLLTTIAIAMVDSELRQLATATVAESFRDARTTGFERRFHFDDEGVHPYLVFSPCHSAENQARRPLIVFLNGLGENGRDGIAPALNGLAQRLRELSGTFPFVVLFPQCEGTAAPWQADGADVRRALGMIDSVQAEYRIDPDRVYLTGISAGGSGVWNFAASAPERFAAIAPVAAVAASEQQIIDARLPVFTFLNRVDRPGMQDYQSTTHRRLIEVGCESRFFDVGGDDDGELDAHNAWDFAFGSGQLFSWFLRHSRQADGNPGSQPLTDDDRLLLTDFKGFHPVGAAGTRCVLEFEFRPTAADTGTITAVGGETGEVLWQLTIMRPEHGSCVLLRSDHAAAKAGRAEAAMSIRLNEWNHIRAELSDGRLEVLVNDWQLLEASVGSESCRLYLGGETADAGAGLEISDIRGVGLQSVAEPEPVPVISGRERLPDFADVSRKDVVDAWQRRQSASNGMKLNASLVRVGNGRWSRFQSALPHQDKPVYEAWFQENTTVFARPWNYPGARFLSSGFARGLSRKDHLSWLAVLRRRRPALVPARQCQLLLSDGQRVETLSGAGRDDPGRRLITSDASAVPGADRPEELFCRIPQLIFAPLARSGFALEPEDLTLVPGARWANGRPCVLLERRSESGAGSVIDQIFVDPAREFAPVRYVHSDDAGRCDTVTIDYRTADTDVPAQWTLASLRPEDPLALVRFPASDSIVHFGTAEVVDVVSEEELPEAARSGTLIVCDRTNGQRDWKKRTNDGTVSDVSPRELRGLLAGGRRQADTASDVGGIRWLAVGFCIFLLLIWNLSSQQRRQRQVSECQGIS